MTINPADIAETLDASHLIEDAPSLSDLKKAVEQKPVADKLLEKEYPFYFSYTDARGKKWVGQFVHKILSIKERISVGHFRSRMVGGTSIDALDPVSAELSFIVADMMYSLITRPDWAKDLGELHDPDILYALYKEVALHDEIFLGRGSAKEESA